MLVVDGGLVANRSALELAAAARSMLREVGCRRVDSVDLCHLSVGVTRRLKPAAAKYCRQSGDPGSIQRRGQWAGCE